MPRSYDREQELVEIFITIKKNSQCFCFKPNENSAVWKMYTVSWVDPLRYIYRVRVSCAKFTYPCLSKMCAIWARTEVCVCSVGYGKGDGYWSFSKQGKHLMSLGKWSVTICVMFKINDQTISLNCLMFPMHI